MARKGCGCKSKKPFQQLYDDFRADGGSANDVLIIFKGALTPTQVYGPATSKYYGVHKMNDRFFVDPLDHDAEPNVFRKVHQ
jgi:hypothetical protein